MWLLYSVITAILESFKDIQSKQSTKQLDEKSAALHFQLYSLLILIPAVIITGIPTIKPLFYPLVLLGSVISAAWMILYMKALKTEDISNVIPLLAFNPVFTALLAIFFDGSFPERKGWLGILLVSGGLYLQNMTAEKIKQGLLTPFKTALANPASKAMLGVALIWSIGAHITKLSATTSSAYFSSLVGTLFSIVIIWIMLSRKQKQALLLKTNHTSQHVLLGVINGLSKITLGLALTTGYTAYVMPIKRTNIILSSLYAKIVLKEPFSGAKSLGLAVMFVGILCIIL